MPGPPPTPTAILKLRGSRHVRDRGNEPQPEPMTRATPPKWMSTSAKEKMREMVVGMRGTGVITESDRDALVVFCQLWSQYQDAVRFVNQHGQVATVTDSKGNTTTKLRPQVKVIKDLMQVLLRYQQEFGMTPSSRTRVAAIPTTDNPASKLLTLG